MSSSEQTSIWKHALLWGGLYLLGHMSLLSPLIVLTIWFVSIPAVVLYVRTNRSVFAATIGIAVTVVSMVAGTWAWLLLALFFLLPSIVMGEAFRRRLPSKKVIGSGVVAYLVMFLGSVLLSTMAGFNLNRSMSTMIRESMVQLPASVKEMMTDDWITQIVQLTIQLIPFYFISTAVFLSVVTYTLSRRLLARTGVKLARLPSIREWKLPRAMVWYYLIALFMDFFLPKEEGAFLTMVVINLVSILKIMFAIQGIAFLFFVAHIKRKAWLPWIGIIVFVFVPPLGDVLSLLGVFDTAFPIRDRLRKS